MIRAGCHPVSGGSTTTRTLAPSVRPLADLFIRVLQSVGIKVTVTSTRRSLDTQAALYANYLKGCSKYPAAKPGHSAHATGYAFDLHLDPPRYADAGRAWEAIGGTWGGRFNDQVHFEVR